MVKPSQKLSGCCDYHKVVQGPNISASTPCALFKIHARDWGREAKSMKHIYKNSFLTVAATKAVDGADGLFADRNPDVVRFLKISYKMVSRAGRRLSVCRSSPRERRNLSSTFDETCLGLSGTSTVAPCASSCKVSDILGMSVQKWM